LSKLFQYRFLLLGSIVGLTGLLIDNRLVGGRLAFAQMTLYTVLVFGVVGIQAGKSLWRPRQLCVAFLLIAIHFIVLGRFADWFPLTNMIVGFVGAGTEITILIILYVRIGQSVDPKGPYGLTEAELQHRRKKQ
jgi:hypothetical protein